MSCLATHGAAFRTATACISSGRRNFQRKWQRLLLRLRAGFAQWGNIGGNGNDVDMVAPAGLSTTTATAASGNDGGLVLPSDGFLSQQQFLLQTV